MKPPPRPGPYDLPKMPIEQILDPATEAINFSSLKPGKNTTAEKIYKDGIRYTDLFWSHSSVPPKIDWDAAKLLESSAVEGKLRDYPMDLKMLDGKTLVDAVQERGLVMEKPQGSSLHHAMDELVRRGLPKEDATFMTQQFQSFVIEHDWSKAFEGAKDFGDGDVRLPFPYTAFEFRITGQRVLVMLGEAENGTGSPADTGILFTGVNGRWYVPATKLGFKNGVLVNLSAAVSEEDELIALLGKQIRAVCIVLDAEVAEKSIVRVPEKLARHRAKAGKIPMKEYHVVQLAKKYRVVHAETPGDAERRSPRLHYRRGHWRHFSDHRTWIKWQLVGDPDLGFVDKHYKL